MGRGQNLGFGHRVALGLFVGLSTLSVGCTRAVKAPTDSVSLTIPFNGSHSSMSAGDTLTYAVVNVQVPGRPAIVREFEYHDSNGIPWGQDINLTVTGIPTGPGFLVQFLGVFETASGASYLITYGDKDVTVGAGTNSVTINAVSVGSATKEGRVAGRYFSTEGGLGPTGTLVARYQPPGGRPPMAIEKNTMVAGYFNIFVLDSIPLTWVLLEPTPVTIFGNLTLGSSLFDPSSTVLKVRAPASYKKNQRNNVVSIEQRVAADMVLGFFKDPNISSSVITGKNVYYATAGYEEGLQGWYGSLNGNGQLINPIVFSSGAVSVANMVYAVGGGSSVTYDNLMTQTSCNESSGSCFNFYHHRISSGDEDVGGINPPFRLVDPMARWGGYLRQTYDQAGGKIDLLWKYLPGAAPADVGSGYKGVKVLVKQTTSTTSSSNNETCKDLIDVQGYTVLTDIITNVNTYAAVPSGLSAGNYSQFQFAVCPYREVNGAQVYVGDHIRSSCSGDCGEFQHFGWGTTSGTITLTSAESEMGVHHSRVSGVDTSTSDLYSAITVSAGSYQFGAADAGKEVLLIVQQEINSSNCGISQGSNIDVGKKAFTRILSASSTVLKIPKGTFMDQVSNTALAAAIGNAASCYVQAVLVPHYKDLTISSAVSPVAFSTAGNTGGGVLPFRVSGTLSIAGGVTISAASTGYPGGGNSTYDGGGTKNLAGSTTWVTGTNAGQYAAGGPGGGAGPTADGGWGVSSITVAAGAPGTAPLSSTGWSAPLMMGGGGGGYGAPGGGIIFVAARRLQFGTGSGFNVGGGVRTPPGGGGGAGTIMLLSETATGSGNVVATGGDAAAAVNEGGGGGGGLFYNFICTDSSTATVTSNVAAGLGYWSTPGVAAVNGQVVTGASISGTSGNPACSN